MMKAFLGLCAICWSVLLQASLSKDIDLGGIFTRDIVNLPLTDIFSEVKKLEKFEISAEFPAAATFAYSGGQQGSIDLSNIGLADSICLDTIISPDQKMIALVCDKKKLIIIDASSGKQLFSFKPERFGTCHKPQIEDGFLYLFCTTSESKGRYVQFHEVYAVNLRNFVVTNTDMNLGDDQFMGWFQFDVQTTLIETKMLNTLNDTNPEQVFTYLVVWDGYNNVAASTWITSYNKNVRFIRVEGGKISNQSILLKVDESDQHGLVYDVAIVEGLLNVVIHANFSRWTQPKGYMFALEVNESFAAVAKTNKSVEAEQFNITDGFFRYVPSIGQYVAWDFKRNELFACAPDATTFVKKCSPGAKVLQNSNNMIPKVQSCVKDSAAVGDDKDSVFLCAFEEKTTECKSAPSSGVVRIRPSGVELLATIPNPSAIGYFYSPSYDTLKILTLTQLQTSGLTPSSVSIDASKLPDGRQFRFAIRNSDKLSAVVTGTVISKDAEKIENSFPQRTVVASGWKSLNLLGLAGSDLKIHKSNTSYSDPLTSKLVLEGPQNNFTRLHRVGNYLVAELYNQGRANVYECSSLPLPNNNSKLLETYCVYLSQVTFDSSRWLAEVFWNEQYVVFFRIRGFNSEQYLTFNTRTFETCVQTITASSPEQVLVNYAAGYFQIIHSLYDNKGAVKIYTMSIGSDCKIEQAALLELQGTGYLTKFTAGLSKDDNDARLMIYQQDLSTPSTLIANMSNLKLINDSIQSSGPVDRPIFDPGYSKYCFLGRSLIVSYTSNGKSNVFQYGIADTSGSRKEFPLKQYNLSDVSEIHCSERYQRIVLVASVKQGSEYAGRIFVLSTGSPRIIRVLEPATKGTNCTRGFSHSTEAFVYSCALSTWSNTSNSTDPQLNQFWETSYSLSESLPLIISLDSSSPKMLNLTLSTSGTKADVSLSLAPFVPSANTTVKSTAAAVWMQREDRWCFVLEDAVGIGGHVLGVRAVGGEDQPADSPQIIERIDKLSSLPEGVHDVVATGKAGLFVAVKERTVALVEFDQSKGLKLVENTEQVVSDIGISRVAALCSSEVCHIVAYLGNNAFHYSRLIKSNSGDWRADASLRADLGITKKVSGLWLFFSKTKELHLLVRLSNDDFPIWFVDDKSFVFVGSALISSKESVLSASLVEGKQFIFTCNILTGEIAQEEIISGKEVKKTILQQIEQSLISGGCKIAAQPIAESSEPLVAIYLENENHITVQKIKSAGVAQKIATLELPESTLISNMQISDQVLGVSLQSSYLQVPLWCFYNLSTAITTAQSAPLPISYCKTAAPSAFTALSPSHIYLHSTRSLFTLSPKTTICHRSKQPNPLANITLNWNTSLSDNTTPVDPVRPNDDKTGLPKWLVFAGLICASVVALAVVVAYCRTENTNTADDDLGVKASFEEQTLKDNEL